MSSHTVRIALANIRVPATPDESVRLATSAVADAGRRGAMVICFPECFVPGYRWPGTTAPSPDSAFLERAWADVAAAARSARITVILVTERLTDRGLQITACVINSDGTVAGWQDKGQIDPSEEATYPALATERRDLPRRLALSRDCAVGRASGRKSCFTHTRRSRVPMVRCSAISPMDRRACSWRIWTSVRPPDCSPRGAGPRRTVDWDC